MTHFKFRGSSDISRTAKARIVKFCALYQIVAFGWQTTPKRAWSGLHNPFSISKPAIISPKWLERESPNFVCSLNTSSASLRFFKFCPVISLEFVKLGNAFLISCDDWCTGVLVMHNKLSPNGCVKSHVISLNFYYLPWPLHQCQCFRMTLKVTFADWNLSNRHTSWNSMNLLT